MKDKGRKQKKAVLLSAGAAVLLWLLAIVLATTAETGTPAAEMSAWFMLLGGVALAVFAICLIVYLAGKAMSGNIIKKSGASRPGRIDLSLPRVQALLDAFGGKKSLSAIDLHMIEDIAMNGDSQSAVVASTLPLLVAAYSEDMDCVAMLHFPEALIEPYGLTVGTRLLSTNYYTPGRRYVRDLIPPERGGAFANMQPVIVDFLSDNAATIAARKTEIPERDWQRAGELAAEYLRCKPNVYRSGDPRRSIAAGK